MSCGRQADTAAIGHLVILQRTAGTSGLRNFCSGQMVAITESGRTEEEQACWLGLGEGTVKGPGV